MDTSKIIKGVVNSGRYTVTAPIVKEDYGLYLQIEGVELPSTYEVDFSNSEHNGTSVTMIGNADGVLIPAQFIKSGKDVFAFLYHVGEDYGRTVYKFRIPNKLRPDRTNEEPTPEEQSVIDQAINALNEAVAQTAEDKADADESAQSAKEDADRAEEARTDAQNYATQAEQSATNAHESASQASASATASAQSASASAQIKSDVEDLVDDAEASANSSGISARASGEFASQAQGFARQAESYALGASGYASQASESAQTASTKASEASQSATTASNKATESAQSATNASQSAQTALQAKTDAQTAQGLAESARDTAVQAKTDAESARDEAQNLVDGISGKVEQIDSNTERIESLEDDRYKPYVTDSASGSIASFPDGADNIPLKSLIVNIDPVQEGTGDPSPTNICPISGWTGMQLTQSNENLIPESLPDNVIKGNPSGGKIVGASNARLFAIPIPKSTTLHVQKKSSDTSGEVICLLDDGTPQVGEPYYSLKGFTNAYDQTYSAQERTWMGIRAETLGIANELFTTRELMVSVGNTRKDYVAPKGYSTRRISWQSEAGTVYGGKLDVLTGKLTVYPYYASYNGETLTGEWISDRDIYAVGTTPTIGAQVVNVGAQGTEIQLEPHEVASLLGQNNIFADTGDTEVEYRANTKLYIEKLTQPEEDDMIADSAITSGQFFMVGNSLYRALANIASGATITVGTNAQRVSLSDALNLVNS